MNVVGLFAGRGDVILAMGLAALIGIYVGWQAKRFATWAHRKMPVRKTK